METRVAVVAPGEAIRGGAASPGADQELTTMRHDSRAHVFTHSRFAPWQLLVRLGISIAIGAGGCYFNFNRHELWPAALPPPIPRAEPNVANLN